MQQSELVVQQERLRAFRQVIDCQNACNLTGVLGLAETVVSAICQDDTDYRLGTERKNRHPLAILFLDKCDDLTCRDHSGGPNVSLFGLAYEHCLAVQGGRIVPGTKEYGEVLVTYYKRFQDALDEAGAPTCPKE